MAETFKILTVEVDKAYTSISIFSVIYTHAHIPHTNIHIIKIKYVLKIKAIATTLEGKRQEISCWCLETPLVT